MFLATMALLYVIGTEVPKTSYLTAIDKLVMCVLAIQFLIALYCSIAAGMNLIDVLDSDELADIGRPLIGTMNLYPLIVCAILLVASSWLFFFYPAYKRHKKEQFKTWPTTLAKGGAPTPLQSAAPDMGFPHLGFTAAGPSEGQKPVNYFFFEKFLNVFGTFAPGESPPGALPDPDSYLHPKDFKHIREFVKNENELKSRSLAA